MNRLLFIFSVTCFLASCSVNPYAPTNRQHKKQAKTLAKEIFKKPAQGLYGPEPFYVATTNFGIRRPSFVIIHHTAQNSCEQTLRTFTLRRTNVSAHYVICKSGLVYHMLNDNLRAWHAGRSRWGNLTDINSASIGIELDNNGFEPFNDLQINSLLKVLDSLKVRYGIPAANFIGHADIAPTRKVDPNIYFPWKKLSEEGFGLWYDDTTGVEIPPHFNPIHGLKLIGYDTRDTVAAIRTFKQKFLQDSVAVLDDDDIKVLFKLVEKYGM